MQILRRLIAVVTMLGVLITHFLRTDSLDSTVVSGAFIMYHSSKIHLGVNTLSFQKHITSQELTKEGLDKLGPVVVTLAECEGLRAHANAVRVRLGLQPPK